MGLKNMVQQNDDKDFIQVEGRQIPAAKVLDVSDVRFVSDVDNGGPRAQVFTITYGADGIALTADIVDDNHLVRGRMEAIHKAVLDKVRIAK